MFKKVINFIRYRKFIEKNKDVLKSEFDLKVDRLYRLGSRISIPNNKMEMFKNYNNSELDVYKTLDEETRKYISKIDRYFIEKNVTEYIALYSADRTDYNEVTVIMTYKLMNVVKIANTNRLFSLISFLGLFSVFFNIFYIIPFILILFFIILSNLVLFKKLFV